MKASPQPCDPTCPGWAVFNEETCPAIQACDACWHGVTDAPTDDDYQADPECRAALAKAQAALPAHHYVFGYGMSGCLYDGDGPRFSDDRNEAISSLNASFEDTVSTRERLAMRNALRADGVYHFRNPRKAGADYCEITKVPGPMPDSDG